MLHRGFTVNAHKLCCKCSLSIRCHCYAHLYGVLLTFFSIPNCCEVIPRSSAVGGCILIQFESISKYKNVECDALGNRSTTDCKLSWSCLLFLLQLLDSPLIIYKHKCISHWISIINAHIQALLYGGFLLLKLLDF